MTTTGGTTHSVSLTGLVNQSTNTRHVRCQAATGHSFSAYANVTFYVRAATPAAPTGFRPIGGTIIGANITRINNIAATTASGVTCTYTTNKGTLTADDITGLTAGIVTISYSCTAGSGNTLSEPITGSWSFTIDTPVTTGVIMQTVSRVTQCPANIRIRARDARDNATYWIKRIDNYPNGSENTTTTYDAARPPSYVYGSQCWMLTNLAYGGGGTNTYGDVKTLANSNTVSYDTPYYMIPPGSNRTTGTTNPSTSTNGTGQYGYLYNWCAAMGVQGGTIACAYGTAPAPNSGLSICPSGWRLPQGGKFGEFAKLNQAINSDSTTSDARLRIDWFGMYGGWWYNGFHNQNTDARYWASTQYSSTAALSLAHGSNYVLVSNDYDRFGGFAIRCVIRRS